MDISDIGGSIIIGVIVGGVLGALLGVPVSYFCQPGMFRAFVPLGDYVWHPLEIAHFRDLRSTVVGVVIVCAIVCAVIGGVLPAFLKTGNKKGQ